METTVIICFIFGVFTIIAFCWFKWILERFEHELHCLEIKFDNVRSNFYDEHRNREHKSDNLARIVSKLESSSTSQLMRINMLESRVESIDFRGNK